MAIVLNGTTGITTPDLDTDGLTSNGTLTAVGNLDILQLTGTSGNAFARFTDSDASSDFSIGADDNSSAGAGAFIVYDRNNLAYRLVLDSAGHAIIPAGVTLGTSAGVYSAANTLDDYEEGTFTPVVTFGGASVGITYTSGRQSGIYTKVGNLVTYSIHLQFTNKGTSTGELQVTGLPFTASNNDKYPPAASFIQSMSSMSTLPIFRVRPNSAAMDCYQMVSSTYSGVTNSNCTNTSGFIISGQFYTDS